jgi:lysophospholipase-3
LQEYFTALKGLIEETYTLNGNTKVVMIAHSMGNIVFLYFLNHMDQSWKDKYIRSYISLAGPWGGAAKTVLIMASGMAIKNFFFCWCVLWNFVAVILHNRYIS